MTDEIKSKSRRDFIQLAGVGVPVAAVTLAVGTQAVQAAEATSENSPLKSAYIDQYLKLARF